MIVGAAAVEVHIHGSRSLKEKRGVVRSITQRVRNRFNLAVSEVGEQDRWQTALLGLAAAGAEPGPVRRVLEKAVEFIEELHLAEVRSSDVEIIRLPYVAAEGELADWDEQADEEE